MTPRGENPSPTNRLGKALRHPFQANRRPDPPAFPWAGPGRGVCLLAPGQLGRKAVRPPTLAPSFPAPGPPCPLTTEPEPDGSQPRNQPHSPVRRPTPSSHLKTPPTSRLLIGSRISANGVGPFWPLNCHGNRPRSAPLLNLLERVIRSFLLFFFPLTVFAFLLVFSYSFVVCPFPAVRWCWLRP